LGISDVTLPNWVKQERTERGERPGGLSSDEREELKPAAYLGRVIPLGPWEDVRYLLALTFRTGVSAARRSSPP
jgi:hypothetical protein